MRGDYDRCCVGRSCWGSAGARPELRLGHFPVVGCGHARTLEAIDKDYWERRLHQIVYVLCLLTHLVDVHCL